MSVFFFFGKEKKKLFKCRRLHTNKEGEGSYAEMKTKDVRHPPLGVDISFRPFDSPQKRCIYHSKQKESLIHSTIDKYISLWDNPF